jgi:hypothetical protein
VPHPPLDELAWALARFVTTRELIHDSRAIMRLGPGKYELDLLNGMCRMGLRYHPSLAIAGMLKARLDGALREVELTLEIVTRAALTMQLTLQERDPAKGYRPINVFGRYEGPYILCQAEVEIMLATEEGTWSGGHRGAVDWPRDWGQLHL